MTHSPVVLQCGCVNAFQDDRYGKGMRVWNIMIKDGHKKGRRCSVCGAVVKEEK